MSRIAVSKAQYFALLRGMPLPGSDLTDKFNSDDEAQLLEAYRRTSKLTERSGLVWVLAHVGSEETAKAFIFTLTQEFKGAKLVADEGGTRGSEAGVMQTIVDCMGLLATRSDTAWEYVKQGTEPSYWQQSVSWTSSTGGEIYGLLAASAIQSVGMANRPDVRQTIDNLKARPPLDVGVPVSMRRVFDGDVMQAAFYADLREEKGDASFYRRLVDAPRDQFDASGDFGRWVAGKGREWDTWYKARLAAEK